MILLLLLAVAALTVYCAFLARTCARLSARYEDVSRRLANLDEKGNRE